MTSGIPPKGHPDTRRRAPTGALWAGRHKETDEDAPALPVPSARFVPVIRHEPMRRSTRRERMEEVHIPFRKFLTPCNVPTSEMTDEERRRYGR
jgi:hypothetical protein